MGNFSESVVGSYTGFHLCAGMSFTGIAQFQLGKLIPSPASMRTKTYLLCAAGQGPHSILCLFTKVSEKKSKERRLSTSLAQHYLETEIFFFFCNFLEFCHLSLNIFMVHLHTDWLTVHPVFKNHFEKGHCPSEYSVTLAIG